MDHKETLQMRSLPDSPSFDSSNPNRVKEPCHESAINHVKGSAVYIDDIPEHKDILHVATGLSTEPYAKIKSINLEKVKNYCGVVDVIVHADIPGNSDISPVFTGDILLADEEVNYIGQPIFAVAARTLHTAKQAVKLAEITYVKKKPLLTAKESLENQSFVLPTHTIGRGSPQEAIQKAPHKISSEIYIKGQEHFYLEGQISMAYPQENGGMHILSSSQHPSEVQKLVAQVLNIPVALVNAETRRMGGGFGGKESQAAALACLAAIFATRNKKPVKYRMPRQDDMIQTGKRHDFWNSYEVGFNSDGEILGVEFDMVAKCGCSADLSDGVVDRAMFHSDNAYFYPNSRISGYRTKTNTVSNTAFRGFGGPQGVLLAECVIDDIARRVGKDPLDIRLLNCYQDKKRTTPYGQTVEEDTLQDLIQELEKQSNYRNRRIEIKKFNQKNKFLKKGLSLTPVKFGISFTAKHLNQGAALIHIYTDGSVHINHGGTEMGQGLFTKVAQIVARSLGINYKHIFVNSTRTDKVPNASPTAASAGTDLNGMAALNAAKTLKRRLRKFATEHFNIKKSQFKIENDTVFLGDKNESFPDFIKMAYLNRVSLSSTGFYKTPKISYDRKSSKGQPFFYFSNGAAVSEVLVDTMTGEYRLTQVDILHDVGHSLNHNIDRGQIEGAFAQGMGWLTTEELTWDKNGHITSNSPANYKIPTASDIPEDFNINFYNKPNNEKSIYRSKAVGEPPLMLATSVWCALKDACSAVANYQLNPPLSAPATPEQVFYACQFAKNYNDKKHKVNEKC